MNTTRYLFYRLNQLKGLNHQGRIKVMSEIMNHHEKSYTIHDIATIAEVAPQNLKRFRRSYDSLLSRSERVYQNYLKENFITYFDDSYPQVLREIYHPPALLFYKGQLNLLQTPCISMVGSREATFYGKRVVNYLVPAIVAEGYTLVSGLAKGIDSCVHRATIAANGATIAVIGNGLDIVYPKENELLQQEISDKQLIISEYPRGSKPRKEHFPQRNRIIAGLSAGLCVIEAKERSGSLITAQLALDMGREVFAVPGQMMTEQSKGCHDLINDGAKAITCAKDIFDELTYIY